MDIARPKPAHIKHHTPAKSHTLMRSAVKKPEASLKRKTKVASHTHALVGQPNLAIIKKSSHPVIDTRRLKRAEHVPHSKLVQRFAPAQTVPMPVAAHKPVPAALATPAAIQAAATEPQRSLDVFERALQRANSHLEPAPKGVKKAKRRRKTGHRALSVSATALAVLLIGGFIAFQNQANLTIRYASNKAGFSANLPSYKPSGFKAGKFSYSPGLVGVTFHNTDSNQNFSLVQKQSTWDSKALVTNYVASATKDYHSIESAGRTIYIYGDNNATWVNGGVWYRITSEGSLTTNDLVNIATSM
jgi:hypothetical protein